MATVFRPPLIGNPKRQPGQPPAWTAPNLLTTTLLVVAVPFNNASAFPQQVQHPSHRLSLNADTSRGTPLTLMPAPIATPLSGPRLAAPERPRSQPADTSRSTPIWLIPAGAPASNPPQAQVALLRALADTSQSSPRALLSALPSFNPPTSQAAQRRSLSDTSQSTPLSLLGAAAAPSFNPTGARVPRMRNFGWLSDTSQSTPFYGLPAAPAFNAPQPAPDRLRYTLADTSLGTPASLTAAPFFNPPQYAPDRVRYAFPDTSRSGSVPDVSAPSFNAPLSTLDRPRSGNADTSQSASIPAPSVPSFNPPQSQVAQLRTLADTSQSAPLNPPPGAPFNQTNWPAPIEYRRLQVMHTYDQRGLMVAAAAVFPLPGQVLTGVVYGPNGNDYTGTLAPSSGGSAYLRRR